MSKLDGKCLRKSVIYKAEVKSDYKTSTNISIASNTFKEGFTNYSASFKNSKTSHKPLTAYFGAKEK